jgi:1-acyl-sn-glycerol-3-phosphate acyltransferase
MLSRVNLFIRSLVFFIYSTIAITIYSIIVVCSFPFPLRYRYALIRYFCYVYINVLRVICGINYVVEGLENIPKDRCGIVLCKHQSAWETFFMPIIFNEPAVIIKRELLWVPFFGWGLAAAEPIAINRSEKSGAMQQVITKGRKCLEEGRWVLVFPEGTRVPAGKVGHYKLGGARLAAATGYPVIPVAHNAGRVWPRRGFIKKPGTVTVVVGPMMETEGRTPEDILDSAKRWIESTVLRIDGLVKKPTG